MTKQEFDDMLLKLMQTGLSISMQVDDDVVWYDLNTNMKSYLHVWWDEKLGVTRYEARYGKSGVVKDMQDLLNTASDCICGRDYMSTRWKYILENRETLFPY